MATLSTYTAPIAAAKDFSISLVGDDGLAYATDRWASVDTLETRLWRGDDQEILRYLLTEWVSASAGTLTVKLADADTSDLAAGRYRMQVRITDVTDGRVFVALDAWLILTESPGLAEPPAVYGTFDQLKLHVGDWVDDLAARSDQSGFAEQRAAARTWFDSCLQRHYRRDSYPRQNTLDHWLDYAWGYRRYGEHSRTLQAWLDEGRLVLSSPAGKQIVRACSYYAAYLVCQAQISGKPDDTYQSRGNRYLGMAENLARSITAEVDTSDPADGIGDLLIDLGTADRLRA